jgi:hypothetical protein
MMPVPSTVTAFVVVVVTLVLLVSSVVGIGCGASAGGEPGRIDRTQLAFVGARAVRVGNEARTNSGATGPGGTQPCSSAVPTETRWSER